MSVNFFLGFRLGVHPEWRDRVGPIVAPGNYKKPETIQKYVDEQWAELEKDPAGHPLGALVEKIAVIGLNGKDPELLRAEDLVTKMEDVKPREFPVRLFSFDIHERMRQVMLTVFERGEKRFPHWLLSSHTIGATQRSRLIDPWMDTPAGSLPRDKFLSLLPITGAARGATGPGDTDVQAVEAAKLAREVAEILCYV